METALLTLIMVAVLVWGAWRNRHVVFDLWSGRLMAVAIFDFVLTNEQVVQISTIMKSL